MGNRSRLRSLVVFLAVFISLFAAWLARQQIYDWARLRGYQPPDAIAQLVADTTMNGTGRHIFYVQHPELNDKATFQSHCKANGEQTIVLGCYINRRGIYMLDVQDDRLLGVEQVTAAHEMLHAAYDRLSGSERGRIDSLLTQAYAGVDNKRIRSTIDSYQKAGADISNELHSILATEVPNLPAELEAYYRRYFDNRSKIVGYSQNYEKAFDDRKAQADSYVAQMQAIEKQLGELKAQIEAEETQLSQENQALESERNSVTDVEAFNARVNSYNAQINKYQADVNNYNALVAQHNELYEKYKIVVLEENQLVKALDSRSATVPAQ